MNKILNIGRDASVCDIVIYDPNDIVSRSHATLRIAGRKYYITDHSTNGTYRNGIRLAPSVEYEVTREDDISFGNVAMLDWNSVAGSKSKSGYTALYAIIAVLAAVLLGLLIWLISSKSHSDRYEESGSLPTYVQRDTVKSESEKNDNRVALPDTKPSARPSSSKPSSASSLHKGHSEEAKPSEPAQEPSKETVKEVTKESESVSVDAL